MTARPPVPCSRLVSIRGDLENQVRSLFKEGGLFPRATRGPFRTQILRLRDDNHGLRPIIEGSLTVHKVVEEQQAVPDKRVRTAAKADETTRRMMSVPGVGAATALVFCQ